MFQPYGEINFNQLFQRHAGIFLPAADRYLLVTLLINAHIQRQHQRVGAKAAEPAFNLLRVFDRRRADHHPRHTGFEQGGNILFRTHTTAHLHGNVNARDQGFQQCDLTFRRIFCAREIDQVQHFCALRRIILQTRQGIVAIVALLAVIALMETDNGAVN
ncbi:hypothetical protein D3C72_941950 [compost metagenome]